MVKLLAAETMMAEKKSRTAGNKSPQSKSARLDDLRKAMRAADLHLKKTAAHLVFGEGSPDAKVFFIGEAPGKNEDLQGLPFVGSAGKILDQLLAAINLKRTEIYITSILKYRPPGNRNPTLDEIISHTPYLIDQVRIIKPKVIVPLGNFATRFVLGEFNVGNMSRVPGISTLHGKVKKITFEGLTFSVIAVYHPAAVLYSRPLLAALKEDFKVIKKQINA